MFTGMTLTVSIIMIVLLFVIPGADVAEPAKTVLVRAAIVYK